MHVFRGESSHRTTGAPARKLWHALHEVDKYLIGQSGWLVNYAKRRRASLRVGTSITEGTANFLVNRRMNKSQQMRWSRRGADLLLQVRCAVYNGMFGAGLGRAGARMRRAAHAPGEARRHRAAPHRARHQGRCDRGAAGARARRRYRALFRRRSPFQLPHGARAGAYKRVVAAAIENDEDVMVRDAAPSIASCGHLSKCSTGGIGLQACALAGMNAYSTRKLSCRGFSEVLLGSRGYALQVQPVEGVNQIHHRKHQERCFPTNATARHRH